ncbi:hypothetical protein COB52_05215 [Candidatus Kaiserbacteria bacterium]|nr:MAG: hypothetical protein COB52_05215 [Candidatus Kaiserbacteria bacterium]
MIGFGERVHEFELTDGTYTMWAFDNPAQKDNGTRDGNQGYSVHPVYFARKTQDNNYFSLFNLNASA